MPKEDAQSTQPDESAPQPAKSREDESAERCETLWNGKRCKLQKGHFEPHLFDP